MQFIFEKIKWHFFFKRWRKRNIHNNTAPCNYFNFDNVVVGRCTYGELRVFHFGNDNFLKIGNYCSIAPNVFFLLKDDHPLNYVSSFPFKVKALKFYDKS